MNTGIKNTLSVIAFLDIWGAKELIKRDADESLNLVYASYTEAIDHYKRLKSDNFLIPKINIFSDNIPISYDIDEDFDNVMECIFSVIAFCLVFNIRLLAKGLLVRGGVTIGYCFSDTFMVWGEALVRAHELESTVAIYPRIVIDPFADEIFEFLEEPKYKKMICRDFDGLYFIDIFYTENYSSGLPLLENLIDDNKKRIDALDKTNLKERQKLKWLQNYLIEKYDYLNERSHKE